MKKLVLFFLPVLMLSSCVELIDDLTINRDGSGSLKLTINLSSSKLKINSYLALDSLNGKRVPKLNEITDKIDFYADKIKSKEGIKNVSVSKNTDDFIFKVNIDFSDIEQLEQALKEVINEENSSWVNFEFDWVKWENNTLTRNNIKIPEEQLRKLKAEEIEDLKKGTYTSITRFQDPIEKYSNELSKISANKLNIMIKTSAYGLAENTQLLKNVIKAGQ